MTAWLAVPACTICKPNENVGQKNWHFIYTKRTRQFEVKLILSSAGKESITNTHFVLFVSFPGYSSFLEQIKKGSVILNNVGFSFVFIRMRQAILAYGLLFKLAQILFAFSQYLCYIILFAFSSFSNMTEKLKENDTTSQTRDYMLVLLPYYILQLSPRLTSLASD